MKTDATSGITGTAGTPLSHQAIQSGRDAIKQNPSSIKSNEAISDTLETSDREADGRQTIRIERNNIDLPNETSDVESDGLDLIG